MKKLILILSILSLAFVATAARTSQVYAYTCPDNTVVADPSPSLSEVERQAAITAACAGHTTTPAFAAGCTPNGTFLGLPTWYKYLQGDSYTDPETNETSCHPKLTSINDIWKVVASVIELLLRLATLIAIGFVIFGGITYITSQANPDKTKQALKTIINSLIGLAITIISAALVSFIAGRF